MIKERWWQQWTGENTNDNDINNTALTIKTLIIFITLIWVKTFCVLDVSEWKKCSETDLPDIKSKRWRQISAYKFIWSKSPILMDRATLPSMLWDSRHGLVQCMPYQVLGTAGDTELNNWHCCTYSTMHLARTEHKRFFKCTVHTRFAACGLLETLYWTADMAVLTAPCMAGEEHKRLFKYTMHARFAAWSRTQRNVVQVIG